MRTRLYRFYNLLPDSFKQRYRILKRKFGNQGTKTLSSPRKARLFEFGTHRDIEFVSFTDMIFLCEEWIPNIDRNFDVIVGIPRSGLLIANIISLKLGKPLTVPEMIDSAWCSKSIENRINEKPVFLLVDDSYQTGASMEKAIEVLLQRGIARQQIKTAALITSQEGVKRLDYFGIEINKKRLFEWNLAHKMMNVVSDLDGVLCVDPPFIPYENEAKYIEWLKTVKPLFIPTYTINTILTSRIEAYREETELWLKQNGVRYSNLIMSSKATRQEQKVAGVKHKIEELNRIKPDIYWESGKKEANEIFLGVECPVLVFEDKSILNK